MAWTTIPAIGKTTAPATLPTVPTGSSWQTIGADGKVVAPKTPAQQPATPLQTNGSTIPASALKGSLGGGYGASNITDMPGAKSSNGSPLGKPLMTFEDTAHQSSDLLLNRVAPTFDPTIPQKIDPSVLENGRMPQSASDAVRKATGAEPDEQLDHLLSLELGGSNDTTNLNPEKLLGNGTQPSLTLENQTAKDVASGKISYVQGQINIARAKGVQLPDDPGFSSAAHPLAGGYAKPAPNQTGTQSQQPKNVAVAGIESAAGAVGGFFKSLFTNPNATINKTADSVFGEVGGNAIVHPIQTIKNIATKVGTDTTATLNNLVSAAKTAVANGKEAAKTGNYNDPKNLASNLNLLTSVASTLFLPVSETFNIASQLPIIKPAADLLGIGFNAAGTVGSFDAGKLLDTLPLSQSTKDSLQSAVESVGALAGQIVIGGSIYEHVTDAMNSDPAKTTLTPEEEKPIVEQVKQEAEQVKNDPANKDAQTEVKPTEAKSKSNIQSVTDKATVDLSPKGKPVEDIVVPKAKPSMLDTIGEKLTTRNQKTSDILPPKTPVDVKGSDDGYKITSDTGGDKVKVVNLSTGNEEEVPRANVSDKTKGTHIVVNGKDFTLTGEAEKRYLEEKQRSDRHIEATRRMSPFAADSTAKGEGMKLSALKRELTGQYTTRELSDRTDQEKSNYSGKKVTVNVDGQTLIGKIKGTPSFGRFKVELSDGTLRTLTADQITDPRTAEEIKAKITTRSDAKSFDETKSDKSSKEPQATNSKPNTEDEIVKPKTRIVNTLKSVEGTGEFSNFKLSKNVEASAIENGLAETLGDLPGSKSIDMKDQAKKVAAFINDNPDDAKAVAMGEKNAPKGILPMAVYKAFTDVAREQGDGDLARDLANSKLSEQARIMGQNIQALKGVNPEDPTAAIKELQELREKSAKDKLDQEVQKAQESIKKAKSDRLSGKTKINWSDLVKELQC